ncbi:hypothetical protein DLD77_08035 [Chitinophaga alhagiae]|uniref:Uncharacterized protein n=1 Tax=Chitinophaga alhagiae TaxID=2203219 RepID=A0ABN5LZC8_9BACT|nr:hypothetical protein DLD77_08035 [Chitinophaga alhagiae]
MLCPNANERMLPADKNRTVMRGGRMPANCMDVLLLALMSKKGEVADLCSGVLMVQKITVFIKPASACVLPCGRPRCASCYQTVEGKQRVSLHPATRCELIDRGETTIMGELLFPPNFGFHVGKRPGLYLHPQDFLF